MVSGRGLCMVQFGSRRDVAPHNRLSIQPKNSERSHLMKKHLSIVAAAALAVAGMAWNVQAQDTTTNQPNAAERAADKTGNALERAAEKTGDAVKTAGEKTKEAVSGNT